MILLIHHLIYQTRIQFLIFQCRDVNKFWVTTGCFPQEIILQFASPIRIGRITVLANKAKTIDLDYTTEDPSGKWSALGTLKMTNNTDSFQNEILTLSDPTDVLYLKFTITSAFDDFVSLHKLRIETK